jgi:hypothetical protein
MTESPTDYINLSPASYPMGTRAPSCRNGGQNVKLTSSAEFKNVRSCTANRQYVIMSWPLVKHRDNFTCTSSSPKSKDDEFTVYLPLNICA